MDGGHIGILLPVSMFTYVWSSHAILHLTATFRSNRTIGGWVMASYRFSIWRL